VSASRTECGSRTSHFTANTYINTHTVWQHHVQSVDHVLHTSLPTPTSTHTQCVSITYRVWITNLTLHCQHLHQHTHSVSASRTECGSRTSHFTANSYINTHSVTASRTECGSRTSHFTANTYINTNNVSFSPASTPTHSVSSSPTPTHSVCHLHQALHRHTHCVCHLHPYQHTQCVSSSSGSAPTHTVCHLHQTLYRHTQCVSSSPGSTPTHTVCHLHEARLQYHVLAHVEITVRCACSMYNSSIIPAVCDTEHSNALVTIMIMTLISVIQQLTVCQLIEKITSILTPEITPNYVN